MHNNFAWSEAFTGNELMTTGNSQTRSFAKAIIAMAKTGKKKQPKEEL